MKQSGDPILCVDNRDDLGVVTGELVIDCLPVFYHTTKKKIQFNPQKIHNRYDKPQPCVPVILGSK
jgi:hypothetical protein